MVKTVKVTVVLPAGVSEEQQAAIEAKAHEAAVLVIWEAGEFSTRQAAAELGLTYYGFLDLLAVKGIPVESGMFDPQVLWGGETDAQEKPVLKP